MKWNNDNCADDGDGGENMHHGSSNNNNNKMVIGNNHESTGADTGSILIELTTLSKTSTTNAANSMTSAATSTTTNNINSSSKVHGDDIGNNIPKSADAAADDANGQDENENDNDDDERRPLVAMNIINNASSKCSGEGVDKEEKQHDESTTASSSSNSSHTTIKNNNSTSSTFSSFSLLARRATTATTTTKSNPSSTTGSTTTASNMPFFASAAVAAAAAATTAGGGFTLLGSIREERDDVVEEEDPDFMNPDPIMNVMDYLEDEIDEHTYDEIIPLQLRMALEDTVFGWDHFLSSLLGHVGYTCGSYLVTFWLITFVVLHEVPWGGNNGSMIQHKHSHPWGMPYELFSILRTSLAIASAISTFRTIRRRRRVWLHRHPSSSSRQQELLLEADQRARRFVLGSDLWSRMRKSYAKRRDRYLARNVHRKLLGAQRMFEKRHRNRVRMIRSVSASSLVSEDGTSGGAGAGGIASPGGIGHENSHHERVRILASSPGTVIPPRDDDTTMSVGGGSSVGRGGEPIGLSTDERHRYHPRSQRHHPRDSHTLPNFAMESVSHDQMPFAHGEIKKIPYVHGGFFGAAPFMLTNPHWIAILRLLMPDVYVEISRRASYAPAPRLIHWAENNPVVAAYGTAHEYEFSGTVPTLEWDVFLDPYLVRRVEIVLSEKEAFLQRQKDARRNNRNDYNLEDSDADGATTEMSALQSPLISVADERLVLSYYDKEIKRRTTILVERMLIAHGNMVQLVLEQTGYLKRYNFSRVKRTRKTLGGGIFARQWLAVYSEAMKLGMGYDEDDVVDDDVVSDSGTDSSLEERDDLDFADFSQMNNDDVGDRRQNESPPRDRRGIIIPDLKSSAQSTDATGAHSMHSDHDVDGHEGPPRKIIMMRNTNNSENDEGILTDCDGSIHSEPSPCKSGRSTPRRNASSRKRRRGRSMTSPPTMGRMAAATSLHLASACPDKTISESISLLKTIMRCSAPFGLVLDMKSRHVSRRVWALVVDYLRDAGARVEGIASFFVEEVRDITQYCSCSVNEFVFTHSAGDIQHGCHSGKIKRGDRVFFNAGSLLWDFPNVYDVDVLKNIIWHRFHPFFDEQEIKVGYRMKPYAKIVGKSSSLVGPPVSASARRRCDSESETYCDESTLDDGDSTNSDIFTRLLIADTKKKSLSEVGFVYEEPPDGTCCSTIQQYKDYYQLSLGVYVQEFAIDEVAISLIVKYVNSNSHVYNLGLSWGGINGLTVKGIQPGRFTATDGFWNQRYGGMPWRKELHPGETS